jgi:hypothetical protein
MRDCDRRVEIRMPHELWEALAVLAQAERVTVAALLRQGAHDLLTQARTRDPARYGALTGRLRDPDERPRGPTPVRT